MWQPFTTHIPTDHCKEDIRLEEIHFSQRAIIGSYFHHYFQIQQKAYLKKKEPTLSTYLYLILLTVKLKNQGRCKMYPEFNKRSYVFFPLKTPNYKILCKWKSICLFLLVAFQPSLLEACYVKRSHLHLIKVLYQCYGNLTTLNNEGNKKYLQRRAPSEISRTQSNI